MKRNDIPGTNGLYQATEDGKIFSVRKGDYVSPYLSTKGYLKIRLFLNGDRSESTFFVHRLIAKTFFGESDLPVNHLNGVKTDNKVSNLEYCSHSENMRHSHTLGRKPKSGKVVIDLMTGVFYDSAKDAAKAGGYNSKTLVNMLSGHRSNRSKYVYA